MPHVRGHRLGGIRPQLPGQLGNVQARGLQAPTGRTPTGARRKATRGGGGRRRPEQGLAGGFDFSQLSRRLGLTAPGQRLGLSPSQFQARAQGSQFAQEARKPGGIISPFENPLAYNIQQSRLGGTSPLMDFLRRAASNARIRGFAERGIDVP